MWYWYTSSRIFDGPVLHSEQNITFHFERFNPVDINNSQTRCTRKIMILMYATQQGHDYHNVRKFPNKKEHVKRECKKVQ